MPAKLATVTCKECSGTGKQPKHNQSDGRCVWCNGIGTHLNVPYPMFCLDTNKCAGMSCCPRYHACCD